MIRSPPKSHRMPEKNSKAPLFSDQETPAGVLTDHGIEAAISSGVLIERNTFQLASLEASSYDIRVGRKAIIGGQGVEIDLAKGPVELEPGAYGGIISYERLRLPSNICARIGSKRALSYD